MKSTIEYSKKLGLSEMDMKTIQGIVDSCNTLDEALEMTVVIFKNRIRFTHLLMIGYLIGQTFSYLQTEIILNQITNLCQRQN